jgi:hypothetical protein
LSRAVSWVERRADCLAALTAASMAARKVLQLVDSRAVCWAGHSAYRKAAKRAGLKAALLEHLTADY